MDEFWASIPIPYQDEDPNFDFVNAVVVSQHFIRAIAQSAMLAEQAEGITREISSQEIILQRAQRRKAQLRKQILAENYGSLTKSASSEVQDAFILMKVMDTPREEELREVERIIEEAEDVISSWRPHLELIKSRMRMIERKLEWAQQYLNFDKILLRLSGGQ